MTELTMQHLSNRTMGSTDNFPYQVRTLNPIRQLNTHLKQRSGRFLAGATSQKERILLIQTSEAIDSIERLTREVIDQRKHLRPAALSAVVGIAANLLDQVENSGLKNQSALRDAQDIIADIKHEAESIVVTPCFEKDDLAKTIYFAMKQAQNEVIEYFDDEDENE